MSFNYDNGAQPPFIYAMVFTVVVVGVNGIMYEICARVSDFVGFKYRDDRESCYIILYTIACMFNSRIQLKKRRKFWRVMVPNRLSPSTFP